MRVMNELTFRAATLDDAAFAADVMTALWPDNPHDPVVARHWWAYQSPTWVERRFVVECGGKPVGFAAHEHPGWDLTPKRWAGVGGELLPTERRPDRLAAVLRAMEERVRCEDIAIVRARAYEEDHLRIAVLGELGFREDRRSRRWELDLVAQRDRLLAMAETSRARMREQGVNIHTLADDRDPDRYEKIWRMSDAAARDIPTTLPHVSESLEDYLVWFNAPGVREDRFWIARIGDEIVGVSVLSYPPVRGVVSTDWTATARSARGRGIARALKCETVAQAIALGVDRVRTGNDAENAPILHLNETMGYRLIPGSISFLKDIDR